MPISPKLNQQASSKNAFEFTVNLNVCCDGGGSSQICEYTRTFQDGLEISGFRYTQGSETKDVLFANHPDLFPDLVEITGAQVASNLADFMLLFDREGLVLNNPNDFTMTNNGGSVDVFIRVQGMRILGLLDDAGEAFSITENCL